MVSEGREISYNAEQSLVARAARNRKVVIANNVYEDAGFLPHRLLPDTASEMAIPISTGRHLFGVLDVQAATTDFFDQLDAEVFLALTSQVAVAMQNAQTFKRSEETLEDLNMLTRRLTNEGWSTYLDARSEETTAFAYDTINVTPLNGRSQAAPDRSLIEKQIVLQDTPIGVLALAEPEEFVDEIDDIMAAVASSLSTHIQNLRLSEETQTALANTQHLYNASDQIARANTVQAILQTLVDATALKSLQSASLIFFEYPWFEDDAPYTAEVIASWANESQASLAKAGSMIQISDESVFHNFNPTTPVIIRDVHRALQITDEERETFLTIKTKSIIGFPVSLQGQWIGLLTAHSDTLDIQLAEGEIQRISNLANQAATAIENRRLFKQTQSALAVSEEQVRRLALLSDLSYDLNAADTLSDVLQLTVDNIPNILQAKRASISFFDLAQNSMMRLMAVSGKIYEDMNIGNSFSYRNNTGITEVIRTRQVAAYQGTVGDEGDQYIMHAPIISQREVIGLVNMVNQHIPYNERDKSILSQVTNLLSAVIETKQLFEAQRQAQEETRTLYEASRKINAAGNDMDVVLHTIVGSVETKAFNRAVLFLFHYDAFDQLEYAEIIANWYSGVGQPASDIGTIYVAAEQNNLTAMLGSEGRFIPNTQNDTELSPTARKLFKRLKITSILILPLVVGERQLGTLFFQGDEAQTLSESEMLPYTSLAPQAAAALQNKLLFDAARSRAEQLAKLSTLQQSLSQTVNEDSMVEVLGNAMPSIHSIALLYVDTDRNNHPSFIREAASWQDGNVLTNHETRHRTIRLKHYPGYREWQTTPDQIIHYADIEETDLDERTKEALRAIHARSITSIPLHSGGNWHAVLFASWPDRHELTDDEEFLMRNIMEPLSAVIASRRSELAEQQARLESERLYNASRRVNESASDLQNLAQLMGTIISSSDFIRTTIYSLESNADGEIQALRVIANWHNGAGSPPSPVNTLYPHQRFSDVAYLFSLDSLFINNLSDEEETRIRPEIKARFIAEGIQSATILPLIIGTQQIGAILLESDQVHTYLDTERNTYISLAPQIAATMQNRILFDEAQARARHEQLLREVTERVRSASDVNSVMKTAVSEVGRVLGRKAFVYLKDSQS